YCYEFGEDKVATPEGKPKFMDMETAKASVDFLLEQSAGRKSVHITFFGGETLMNFPLLKNVVAYANEQASGHGRAPGAARQAACIREWAWQLRHHRTQGSGADCESSDAADHGAGDTDQGR